MKIRGNLVGTTQKPERVVVRATELTEEQKAQVRENIGAVTLSEVLAALPIYNGEVEEV